MNFYIETQKNKEKRISKWHKWFAWYPVRLVKSNIKKYDSYIWLKAVLRKGDYPWSYRDDIRWYFKELSELTTKETKMESDKSNYEKTMDLKKEYEDKKAELERVQKELSVIKEKAKEELNWILNDNIEDSNG